MKIGGVLFAIRPFYSKRARFFLFLFKWSSFSRKEKFSSFIELFFPFFSAYYLCLQRNLLNKSTNVKRAMRNENLLSFLLIKRRILKLLAIKYAYSLIVLCGISFMACSDDDPVKKNPYLQTSTRAMLKEVVEVVFNNIDSNTDITVDFGDGTVKEGKAATPITHAYTQSGDYTMLVTAGERVVQKRIRIYDLLALTEAMKQFRDADNKMVWAMTHRSHTTDKTIPENSVSAVEAAINAGADVIECDTHLTSDGVVMVCHDQTINATTNGTGDITKMTYAEIQQYNLLDRNGRVTDEKMPTLEEFLKAGRGKYISIWIILHVQPLPKK